MNTYTPIKFTIITLLSLCGFVAAYAGAGHDHGDQSHSHDAEKVIVSPNGGRIVTVVKPNFEFLLRADRSAQITFIDDAGKALVVADQQISLVGGDRSSPVTIDFVEKDGTLVSEAALPDIKNMPIVLQIKSTPDSKIVREKFYLNLSACGSCSYQEYACICGH